MLLGLSCQLQIGLFNCSLNDAVKVLDAVAQLQIDALKSLNVLVFDRVALHLLLRRLWLEIVGVGVFSSSPRIQALIKLINRF